MAVAFRNALNGIDAEAPDGVAIGIVGEDGAGKSRLLRLAGGRVLGPDDPLEFGAARLLLIDETLDRHDPFVRECAALEIESLRRAGATVLLVSHDENLLLRLADEIWWLDRGRLAGRGDPAEILRGWRCHIANRIRAWGETARAPLDPRVRRGDRRAEVETVETLGENGRPTLVWRSGELAVVRVSVRFRDSVADPVVGIMIRTRVGLNVYGTNTELENLKLGPRAPGDTLTLTFGFRCELCPGDYTLTVASHDPDGVWHDWLEDAVAFSVTDARYTAGVANLRATVTVTSR
jgi:lipopolysaccharide transport system ATP-binding protein